MNERDKTRQTQPEPRSLSRGAPNEHVKLDGCTEIIIVNRRGQEVARTKIDTADLPLVAGYRWRRYGGRVERGERATYVHGRPAGSRGPSTALHRLLLDAPDGMVVDHFDGDGLNNRRSNLRVVTGKENQENMKVRTDNTSGFRGATWDKQKEKWRAGIGHNGRQIHVGYFDDADAAGAAAHEARERLYTNHQTRINDGPSDG